MGSALGSCGGIIASKAQEPGIGRPINWAGLRGDRDRMRRILTGMGVLMPVEGDCSEEFDLCMNLQASARSAGSDWVERSATQSDF